MFIVNPFSLLWNVFFLKKIVFPLVSLSLAYRWVLMGGAIKYFLKNYRAMKYLGLSSPGVRIFFEKFVKPSTTPSYILNVRSLNALNVYQINLYQNLNIMHRIKMWNIPEIFHETIRNPNHKYPTTFSNVNYSIQKCSLKSTKCSVSYRWPTLRNTIPW